MSLQNEDTDTYFGLQSSHPSILPFNLYSISSVLIWLWTLLLDGRCPWPTLSAGREWRRSEVQTFPSQTVLFDCGKQDRSVWTRSVPSSISSSKYFRPPRTSGPTLGCCWLTQLSVRVVRTIHKIRFKKFLCLGCSTYTYISFSK